MVQGNHKEVSLYEEAKAGLSSLIQQTVTVFIGFAIMLLITGGTPSSLVVALSFCLGTAFVAWSEQKRIKELRATNLTNNLEVSTNNVQQESTFEGASVEDVPKSTVEQIICKTEQQLKDALSNKLSIIRVEDSGLVNKVKLIKQLKPAIYVSIKISLTIVINAAVIVVYSHEQEDITFPGANSPKQEVVVFPGVKDTIRASNRTAAAVIIAQVGLATAICLIDLGVTFGRIDLLNVLYHDYEITESRNNYLALKKR